MKRNLIAAVVAALGLAATTAFAEPTRISAKKALKLGPVSAKFEYGFLPLSLTVIIWQQSQNRGVVD